ncbi:hypothetical protein B0A52_09188 [Exophiala mesophila]|uniref:Uncharacterized protein n=1 Tax=Exophiala mesophila TaxID=212818 RepID=A0A438MTG4_EXOME|nr:hypothetical protein B0A52_09188 [Exophiala mesophila]
MGDAPFTELRFVPERSTISKREQELEIARQRSHAAKVSHQKRRLKQQASFADYSKIVYYAPETRTYKVLVENDSPDQDDPGSSINTAGPAETQLQLLQQVDETARSISDIIPGRHSDPFNAQGVPISPRINQLLTFVRDIYLPGLYVTSFTKRSGAATPPVTTYAEGFNLSGHRRAFTIWTSMKEELTDQGRALAWLSSYAPVMARYSSPQVRRELLLMATDMKLKSMSILKKKIGSLSNTLPPDIALLAQIVSLFRASCKERDLNSAKVHAEIIRCLIDRIHQGSHQIRTLFITLLSNDTEVALSNMSHTFFEYERWVEAQFQKFWWNQGIFNLPPVPLQHLDLHPSIRVLPSRSACIRLRRYLMIRRMKMNLKDPEDVARSDVIFAWVSNYSMYDLGLLMNVYVNLLEGRGYDQSLVIRSAEASVALTALYCYRWGIHQATIYGGDHRDGMHLTIINRLQNVLQTTLELANPQDLLHYQETILWMLFYGARYEYRVNRKNANKTTATSQHWFGHKFAQQVHVLGLPTWEDVRQIMRRFVFFEFLEWDVDLWFEETLQEFSQLSSQV